MSVLDHQIDPDPDPNEALWNAAEDYVDALEDALGKSKCTAEMDSDADPERISVYISFHGLTLEDFANDLEDRIAALYWAMVKS